VEEDIAEDVSCFSVGRTNMIRAAVERCAGTDVGKKFLAVCMMIGPLDGGLHGTFRGGG
jgi:hypothetical protein